MPARASDGRLSPAQVGALLGISGDTVRRNIPREQLDYTETPGNGTGKGGHRRYRLEDVQAYARTYLGREV